MPIANFSGSTIGRVKNTARPLTGGTPFVFSNYLLYTDITTKALFTIPKGFIIAAIYSNVEVLFNAGSTNVVDIGDFEGANTIKNDLAVGSAIQANIGWVATKLNVPQSRDNPITAIYVPSGSAPGTGKLHITFLTYNL